MRTELRTPHVTVTPGRTVMIELEVANTADIIDGITAIVDGLNPSWVRMPTPVLTLFPDATGAFPLHVSMPRDTVAGEYLVTVQMISTVDPTRTTTHDLWLTVERVESASMRMRPSVVIGGSRGEFDVVISNDGNTEEQFGVSVIDETRIAECSVEPLSISVPPGQQGYVRVRARGPRPWFGQAASRTLLVTATSPAVQLEGTATFTQRPRIARGLLTMLVLGGIVALWATIFLLVVDALRSEEAPAKAVAGNFNTGGTSDVPLASIAATMLGTVTAESTGEGLERITVEGYRITPDGSTELAGSAATAEDGTYALGALVPGTYKLRFTGDGYDEVWYPAATDEGGAEPVSVAAKEEVPARDVLMRGKPGSFGATIESPDASGAIAATVTVTQVIEEVAEPEAGVSTEPAPPPPAPIVVQSAGELRVDGLVTPGTYRILVQSAGFETLEFEETLAGGEVKVLNTIRLGAADGSVSGRVTTADGTPLGNVTVSVRSGDIEQETTTPTAGNIGAFVVEKLPTPRTYVITFTLEGFSSETIALELTAGQPLTGVNAVLVGGTGTITGVVNDIAGVPLGGVTVTVTRGEFTASTATLTTGSDVAGIGGYEIAGIPTPGIYTVTFSAPGFVDETRIVRFLAPGLQPGTDAAMRAAQSTISGRVAEGLAGLPGVTVTLTDGLTSRTTTTASSPAGDYSFANVDPGTYTLTFALPGYRTEIVIVRMLAGESLERNVAMVGG
jgi:hypothetical protein